MKKIERLKIKLRKSESRGIFHDSRSDIRQIAQVVNAMIEKQNEMIDAINQLTRRGEEDKP